MRSGLEFSSGLSHDYLKSTKNCGDDSPQTSLQSSVQIHVSTSYNIKIYIMYKEIVTVNHGELLKKFVDMLSLCLV